MNSGIEWDRAFTGQVLDAETDLMLYRNRYYCTNTGRFVTRDPIGYDAEDVNLYRYVGNNSAIYIDSLGLQFYNGAFPRPGNNGYGSAWNPQPKTNMRPSVPKPPGKWNPDTEIALRLKIEECARQLCRSEAEKCKRELAIIIQSAKLTPVPPRPNRCWKWVMDVMNDIQDKGVIKRSNSLFTINQQAWDYPVGIPWTDWRLGHAAIEITFTDGTTFYFDDGWWGPVFKDENVPFIVNEYNP